MHRPLPHRPHLITNLPRQLTGGENSLIVADNRFAFSLLGEIARQASPDSNLFISPLSTAMALALALALALAYHGAAGTTQAEMRRTLELGGMTLNDVNRSYHRLIGPLGGLDPQVAFTLANSVWDRQSLALSAGFLDATRTDFDAPVQGLDFASPAAAPTINGCVSDKTMARSQRSYRIRSPAPSWPISSTPSTSRATGPPRSTRARPGPDRSRSHTT